MNTYSKIIAVRNWPRGTKTKSTIYIIYQCSQEIEVYTLYVYMCMYIKYLYRQLQNK